MKKLMITAIIMIALNAHASNEKIVKSSVKRVTIFTQAAQVFRNSTVTLNPGITELVFSGISPFINPASLQAGGKGNFIVLEVKHNIKYPEPPKPDDGALPKEIQREIKLIEDSLTELAFVRDELTDKKNRR